MPSSSNEMHVMICCMAERSALHPASAKNSLHYITGARGGGSPLLSAAPPPPPPPPPPALTHFAAGLEGKKVLCNRLPLYCKSHPSFLGREQRMTHGAGEARWHRKQRFSREPDALQPAGKAGPELWKANAN